MPYNLHNLVVIDFDSTEKFINKIDELRAISGHVLGATRVQIQQNNLDNLQSIREEEDGATEVSDLRDVLSFILLAVLDFATLGLVLGTDLGTLGLLVYTLVTTCSGATTSREMGTLRGTLLVAVILVKGHAFLTKLKALIDQGVADALAARDVDRSRNGEDNHDSGTGVKRQAPLAREMFPEESDKIKSYVSGLPDMIHESVMASKPKTMHDAVLQLS
nr:hypothetical protein [Tanacetum cinerariifolium]